MTREEAKGNLIHAIRWNDMPKKEVLEMAIKALEQETVLNKIRAEISCNIVEDDTSGNTPARLRADWEAANKAHMKDIAILDKYFKREVSDKK